MIGFYDRINMIGMGMIMKTEICDICGKVRDKGWAYTEISGKVGVTKSSTDKNNGVSITSYEVKDIYLCPCCSKKVIKCFEALKQGKRIRFRGSDD